MVRSLISKQEWLSDRLFRVVPVNLKDRDAFHLTIEEYLLALISLLDELVRYPHALSAGASGHQITTLSID
jgi:hypothetical protein